VIPFRGADAWTPDGFFPVLFIAAAADAAILSRMGLSSLDLFGRENRRQLTQALRTLDACRLVAVAPAGGAIEIAELSELAARFVPGGFTVIARSTFSGARTRHAVLTAALSPTL
jgi:hypothetical protein